MGVRGGGVDCPAVEPPADRTADLRLAILSALADPIGHAGASAGERPAFRRFAGKSVLAHQIDCAAHLACDRVICLAAGLGPEMAAVRSYAERAGVRFDMVDSIPRLTGLVTADDEVVVIADGILPDRTALIGALADRSGVVAFPAEPALGLGFERLDAARAWSGALRMRGAGVARLADLPGDCDLASSLLRIALQSGVRVVDLDAAPLTDGSWQRRVERQVDRLGGAEAERRWITRQVQPASFAAPGLAFAQRLALRWAHDAGGGRWGQAPHLAALLAGGLALGAGLASWPLTGLAFLLVASFALAMAQVFDRVEALGAPLRKAGWVLTLAHWVRDGLLVGLMALLIAAEPGWLRVFLPLTMVALMRLGEENARLPLRTLYGDRIVLLTILLAASTQSWAGPATAGIVLLALAESSWSARVPRSQLTAD